MDIIHINCMMEIFQPDQTNNLPDQYPLQGIGRKDPIFLRFSCVWAPWVGGHHANNEINICLIPESFSHPPEIHPAYPIKQGVQSKQETPIACIFAFCNGGGVSEIRKL